MQKLEQIFEVLISQFFGRFFKFYIWTTASELARLTVLF